MKKTYMTPQVEIFQIKAPMLLTGSNSIISPDLDGLDGFGGLDTGGDNDPASRLIEDFLGFPM